MLWHFVNIMTQMQLPKLDASWDTQEQQLEGKQPPKGTSSIPRHFSDSGTDSLQPYVPACEADG